MLLGYLNALNFGGSHHDSYTLGFNCVDRQLFASIYSVKFGSV